MKKTRLSEVQDSLAEHVRQDEAFQQETRFFRESLTGFMEETRKSLAILPDMKNFNTLWDERNEENGAKKFRNWLASGAGAIGLVGLGVILTHYWP